MLGIRLLDPTFFVPAIDDGGQCFFIAKACFQFPEVFQGDRAPSLSGVYWGEALHCRCKVTKKSSKNTPYAYDTRRG